VSFVVALSLVSFSISAMVALVSARVGALPGWRAQRWLAVVAVLVGCFSLANVPLATTPDGLLGWAIPWSPVANRLQLFIAGLSLWAWTRYARAYLGQPDRPLDRVAAAVAVGAGALCLVPGLSHLDLIEERVAAGLRYNQPREGPLFAPLAGLLLLSFLPLAWRFAAAWRRGLAGAGLHTLAFLTYLVLGANDALVALRLLPTPYLLDLAEGLPVGLVGLATLLRLVREAGELAGLRGHLEAQVAERSHALSRSTEALHRAEKLAAVGELAAGIAHEVNNPATAAAVNVQYLAEQLRHGAPPADAAAVADEALLALRRIGEITRRLTGASRLATANVEPQDVPVRAAVEESLRLARARVPDHVRVAEGDLDGLVVRGDGGLLVQVLVNLVINGAQAVPPGRPGRVVVGAARRGDRVAITVADDGEGMPPEVLARVFEPFFTTKPPGVGSGLGLAISRGLLATVGGDLRLESRPGHGTCATVDLPAAGAGPA
jgi:signal transduction histidine kinase